MCGRESVDDDDERARQHLSYSEKKPSCSVAKNPLYLLFNFLIQDY